jgi:hypothetical protein
LSGKAAGDARPRRLIRIAITAAYHDICPTLAEDAPLWPMHRQGCTILIHIEAAVLDRSRAC